jgi:hypothetical protein
MLAEAFGRRPESDAEVRFPSAAMSIDEKK